MDYILISILNMTFCVFLFGFVIKVEWKCQEQRNAEFYRIMTEMQSL